MVNVWEVQLPENRKDKWQKVAQCIKQHIQEGSKSPFVKKVAVQTSKKYPNPIDKIKAIVGFMQGQNYKLDNEISKFGYQDEVLQGADYFLSEIVKGNHPEGDCDCFTITGESLLRSLGFKTRSIMMSNSPTRDYYHIFSEVWIPEKGYVPIEWTKKWPLGRAPPYIKRGIIQ